MNDFVITIDGEKKLVSLNDDNKVVVDGKEYFSELLPLADNSYILKVNNKFYEVSAGRIDNGSYTISLEGNNFQATIRSALQEKANQILQQKSGTKKITEIKAPMPGMIIKILKESGVKISQGETILILEAMKMENDLRAPCSGIIKDVFIKEGTAVEKGAKLFSIE